MPQPQRDPHPGGSETVALRVQRVPDGQPLAVVFLFDLRGLLAHYKKSGSTLCWSATRPCSLCDRGAPQYQAYAPIEAWDPVSKVWMPRVLEITGTLEERLRGRELRGEEWLLWKDKGPSRRRTFHCTFTQKRDVDVVPQAFGIEGTLKRLYRTLELPPWCLNPLPTTEWVQKSQAPPPLMPQSIMAPPEVVSPPTPEQIAKLRAFIGRSGTPQNGRVREEMLCRKEGTSDNGGAP